MQHATHVILNLLVGLFDLVAAAIAAIEHVARQGWGGSASAGRRRR